MLREAENKIKIEGILSEKNIKYGSYEKNGKTIETIGGTIKVLVDQEIDGQTKELEIPVSLFSSKYTNEGKVSKLYTGIEKIMNDYVSIGSGVSKDAADKVRITGAKVRINTYKSQTGSIVSYPRIEAKFVNLVTGKFNPCAEFTFEFYMCGTKYATDNEGVELEPKVLEVTTIIPQYGGKIDKVTLLAKKPSVIEGIESCWEKNESYKASGILNFLSETEEVTKKLGFGDSNTEYRTHNVSEFIITAGTEVPLEGDLAFDKKEISYAIEEKKAEIENIKNSERKVRKAPAATITGDDLGF